MYGNVVQCERHVNLYFRYVSGNLEKVLKRQDAILHANESYVCCLSRKVTSHRSVNNAE